MSDSLWNPLDVCEMGLPPRAENKTCCGRTVKGASCKNRVKLRVTEKGHQKLTSLARHPLDLTTLELALCDIAKDFLCERWHRRQQVDDIAHRWYQAAVRNAAPANLGPDHSLSAVERISRSSDPQQSEPDWTYQPLLHEASPTPPVYHHPTAEPSPSMGPFVTAATLRADSVPWHISPDRPAFLLCATNIRAGVQGIELYSLNHNDDVSSIHCTFCLAEVEESANDIVVLHCIECRALSHLACIEDWIDKRDTGFNTSCCVCRNEGALEAFIRPHGGVSTDTGSGTNDATAGVPHATTNAQLHHLPPTEELLRPATRRRSPEAVNSNRWSARLGALRRQLLDPPQHGYLRRSARLSTLGNGQ